MAFNLPIPGVIYQVLHYMLALKRLGYDAYYIEDSDRWVYDSSVGDVVEDASRNVSIVSSVFDAHGFADRWGYHGEWDVNGCYGMEAAEILSHYSAADALLNVTGQDLSSEQLSCKRRIYIESDPFASQVRVHQGDRHEISRLEAHDTHFTFGENIGAADCLIPATPFNWHATRQPVDPEIWKQHARVTREASHERYTTITTWLSQVRSVAYNDDSYHWQKGREFERFSELPSRSSSTFEIASNGGEFVPDSMRSRGWRHVPVEVVANDVHSYREYIRNSRGEFTVSRDQYVRPKTGWFSDRSACYLMSGRPVITQETGFSKFLPTGCGLFGYDSLDGVVAAVETIEANYKANVRAAAELAHEYFSADKVVGDLMKKADLA